jgi:hypothetical protein
MNYNSQSNDIEQYFSQNGWKKLQNLLVTYANPKTVLDSKLFILASPSAAPTVFNQGLINQGSLAGRYGWWVQMPLDIRYTNAEKAYTSSITVKVLLIRVPIVNDLSGIAIEDILVSNPQGGKAATNG